MKKRAKNRVVWQGGRPDRVSEGLKTLLWPMVEGIAETHQSLLELFQVAGFEALRHQLSDDVEAVVGPKGRRNREREAYRWGSAPSEFVLGGRKVALERPRVRRREGGEVMLPSVLAFQDEDPFTARVIEQTLVGVSQRGYGRSLEVFEAPVRQRATASSPRPVGAGWRSCSAGRNR
jgi:putative transposase